MYFSRGNRRTRKFQLVHNFALLQQPSNKIPGGACKMVVGFVLPRVGLAELLTES